MKDTIRDWYETKKNIDDMARGEKNGLKQWEAGIADLFPAHARVLDVGCGMGREAFALAALGFRVTGIDTSREAISRVIPLAAKNGCDIPFSLYDGHTLPCDAASFDAVIIWSQTFGLMYGDAYKREFFTECRRVLVPGGLLSFSGHDYAFEMEHYSKYMQDGRFYPYANTELYWETFCPSDMTSLAERAGYTVLSCGKGEIYTPEDGTILHCLCRKD